MTKRSKINIDSMRKSPGIRFALAPLALLVLTACDQGQSNDTVTVKIPDECKNQPGVDTRQCTLAYYRAVERSKNEMPRFTDAAECEQYYGECKTAQNGSGGDWFIPFAAGYIASEMLDDLGDGYKSRYYRRHNHTYTPFRGSVNSNMTTYRSSTEYKKVAPKPKLPVVKSTATSRSGFGNSAKAKSSWGGSSSRSGGWGG